jgi:hypothetical protein
VKLIARDQVVGGHGGGWGSYEKLSVEKTLLTSLLTKILQESFLLLKKRQSGARFGTLILRPSNPSIQGSRLHHLRAIGWIWVMTVTFYLVKFKVESER